MEVRTLFDALLQLFPQFDEYIGANADIVGSPAYESAIVNPFAKFVRSFAKGVSYRADARRC